ncbi:RNA polymerase sigma factor [bacterium]|nr:RNA polymerase sigma factor [bacterium]
MKELEAIVEEAKEGNRDSLEEIVRGIQDRIYGLALKMLWHPEDAEDATQEILVRIVTHLSDFRNESAFTTWVYRIACNYLLTAKKRRMESPVMSFQDFAKDLDKGLRLADLQTEADEHKNFLIEEIKIGCTQGMLLCLDREHRLAYILGEILEMDSQEAAAILEITPEAFRKRLSRSRKSIVDFMHQKCGIFNPSNPCRCEKRISYAIQAGRVNPKSLLFSGRPTRLGRSQTIQTINEIEELRRAAALYRSHPDFAAPDIFVKRLRALLQSGSND